MSRFGSPHPLDNLETVADDRQQRTRDVATRRRPASESAGAGESSVAVRERVLAARKRQGARGTLNAMMSKAATRESCALDATSKRLIADAVDRGGMSARAVHRAWRVARTIADLANEENVTPLRLEGALQYRAYESRRVSNV